MTVTWEPPGGGWWQLEEVHVRGWQPRVFQERAPEAFKVGFRGERRALRAADRLPRHALRERPLLRAHARAGGARTEAGEGRAARRRRSS